MGRMPKKKKGVKDMERGEKMRTMITGKRN